jgi:hypothetical protein
VVKFKHPVEQVKRCIIVNLAYVLPVNPLLLHLIWDQATIAQFKSDLLDVVRTEQTHEGD